LSLENKQLQPIIGLQYQRGGILKNAILNNMPRTRLLAIAAAAAAISACGGGGGGGGGGFPILPIAPAPAPAPPSEPVADNSAPCFNEADFREGTTVEFEAAKVGADAASDPFQRKSVTEKREAFAGANPISANVESSTVRIMRALQSTVKKEYKDLVGGNILLYGKSTTYTQTVDPEFAATFPPGFPAMDKLIFVSQAYEPPFTFPVDMKPGQVASQKSTVTKTKVVDGRSDPATSIAATGELTYVGREKLETPVGTFDTCKLSLKITVGASVISTDATREFWLAAEGPYQGQLLKGGDTKSSWLVTKMTYSPK
jgi:hypothetical protein